MAESASVEPVPASTTSAEIVPDEHGQVIVWNDSDATLYLRYGRAPATTDDWSVQLDPDDVLIEDSYRGPIQGVWASSAADGAARVTVAS